MREGPADPWSLKEAGQGTRTKSATQAELEDGVGLPFSFSGRTEQPRARGREGAAGCSGRDLPAETAVGNGGDEPPELLSYCSVCSSVFLIGILVHFSGLTAFSPSGNSDVRRNISLTLCLVQQQY